MKVYRGVPHPANKLKNSANGQRALGTYHRWWSARREIAAIWAGTGGTILVGETENSTPKGEAQVIDIQADRNAKITIVAKEAT